MDKRTYEALVASVEKWRKNAAVKRRDMAKVYSKSCPLCRLFIDDGCVGCPAADAVNKSECRGTPWNDAEHAYKYLSLETFRQLAQSEADFLAALVPAGGPDE